MDEISDQILAPTRLKRLRVQCSSRSGPVTCNLVVKAGAEEVWLVFSFSMRPPRARELLRSDPAESIPVNLQLRAAHLPDLAKIELRSGRISSTAQVLVI